MDLSELTSTHSSANPSLPNPLSSRGAAPADAPWTLTNQIAAEVACALTPALDSVHQMQATGRIDRAGLHALVTQIERARHASMLGQQIARLAHGGIQQQPEALNLSQALRDALAQRHADLNTRGVAVHQAPKPAEVVVDATLLSALLSTLLDWSLSHACTSVDMRLDTMPWPAHARLMCRYGHTPKDRVLASDSTAHSTFGRSRAGALDCLSWQLLVQLVSVMSLRIDRADTEADTTLTLEFPDTVNDSLEGAAPSDWDGALARPDDSQPLAGAQVLVIATGREVLNQIRQTLLPMRVGFDSVTTVDGARDFCRQGLPQAIIYESVMFDSAFDSLRSDIRQQCPELAWIEIVEQGDAFEISSFGGLSMARVGRDAIATSLPSALMFELAGGL